MILVTQNPGEYAVNFLQAQTDLRVLKKEDETIGFRRQIEEAANKAKIFAEEFKPALDKPEGVSIKKDLMGAFPVRELFFTPRLLPPQNPEPVVHVNVNNNQPPTGGNIVSWPTGGT